MLLVEVSKDAVGFAACEVARNALHGLPIDDEDQKAAADKSALALSLKLIKRRGMDELLAELEAVYCPA